MIYKGLGWWRSISPDSAVELWLWDGLINQNSFGSLNGNISSGVKFDWFLSIDLASSFLCLIVRQLEVDRCVPIDLLLSDDSQQLCWEGSQSEVDKKERTRWVCGCHNSFVGCLTSMMRLVSTYDWSIKLLPLLLNPIMKTFVSKVRPLIIYFSHPFHRSNLTTKNIKKITFHCQCVNGLLNFMYPVVKD